VRGLLITLRIVLVRHQAVLVVIRVVLVRALLHPTGTKPVI